MATPRYSRKWKVFVIQNVHGMLGWARSFDQAQSYYEAEIHNNLDLMDRSEGYTENEQHRFTVDCAWIVREYLARRPDDADRVRRRMQERRLEVSAYEASVTDLCLSGEEFVRHLATRAELERQGYGRTALTVCTDIHDFSFGFPALAAGSGIKYLLVGTNTNDRCGFPRYPALDVVPRGRALFWWEGIDGQRILSFHYGNYIEASDKWNGDEFDPAVLERYLARFEAMGDAYPYDAVVLLGTGGDAIRDGGFYHTLAGTDRIRDWNHTQGGADPDNLDAPLLINGPAEQFFTYVEQRFGSQIPSFRGGWGGGAWLWDTQAQRFAKTGLQARQSAARIRVAETLSASETALFGTPYPKQTFDQVYQYRIWHDEHDTNGTRPLVSQEVKEEWRAIHQRWGQEMLERPSLESLALSLRTLAAHLARGEDRALMVYNPLSRPRSDVVRWPCAGAEQGMAWQVADSVTGEPVPSQYVRQSDAGYLLFMAESVPSLGYKKYVVKQVAAVPSPATVAGAGNVIENDYYRITCDRAGAVTSIWDKTRRHEIVRQGALFNTYINSGTAATAATITVENDGPVACNLCIRATGQLPLHTQSLSSRIWLYHDLDRIELVNEFAIADHEQDVYFDFPLNLDGPIVYTLEGAASSILVAGQHEFDEARLEHWNTFSFVDATSADYGLTFCSPDARQVYLGGRIVDNQMPQSDLTHPELVVRVIGGGPLDQDWIDPNGGPVDNPYRYRFSLAGHAGPVDVAAAVEEGWAQLYPLQVHEVIQADAGVVLPNHASLWRVPAPLLLSAFKRAEEGTDAAYILRLWNPTPNPVRQAGIASDLLRVLRARVNDHVERDTGPELALSDGAFFVDVGARSVVTVRLELASHPAMQTA